MKFQKKPVVVEAEQFDPQRQPWPEGVYGVRNGGARVPAGASLGMIDYFQIDITYGPSVVVRAGDWIVRDPSVGPIVYEPEIFAATYEAVE